MPHDWRVRLSETIAVIESTTVGTHDDKRLAIAQLLRGRNLNQATSDSLSQGANTAILNRAAVKDARQLRRAVVLVQSEFLNQTAAQASAFVQSIPDASLPGALGTAIGMAYTRMQQPLDAIHRALLANPLNFLASHKVQLFRSPASTTAPHGLYLDSAFNRYVIRPATDADLLHHVHLRIDAANIHVQPYSAVAGNIGAITGYQVTPGTHLVITTQLTGCSVVYQLDAARTNLVAAHIQPTGAAGSAGRGYNLATTLRAGAGFANGLPAGAVGVFGASQTAAAIDYDPNSVPARHTFFLGVLTGHGWELHCQRHNIGNAADTIDSWRILP